jgi:uncharacterized repeat protein (TIGR04076 family)
MAERKRYKVAVKVVSRKGDCAYHKVGDEWIIGHTKPEGGIGITTPEGICLFAFQSLLPAIWTLVYGGSFLWDTDPDVIPNEACPDAKNPVVFELRRIRE